MGRTGLSVEVENLNITHLTIRVKEISGLKDLEIVKIGESEQWNSYEIKYSYLKKVLIFTFKNRNEMLELYQDKSHLNTWNISCFIQLNSRFRLRNPNLYVMDVLLKILKEDYNSKRIDSTGERIEIKFSPLAEKKWDSLTKKEKLELTTVF